MMLSHYIKIAFRALRKDFFFSAINIAGLAIGISAVAVIFVFVSNQLNYDNWLPNTKTLYRVETLEMTPGRDPVDIARAPGPVRAALMKDFPQIADVTRGYMSEASIEREGQPSTQTVLAADKNFFGLLGIRMVKGDPRTALRGTSSIALSERRARELFGRRDAIGQRVTLRLPEARDFVVSAVFEDIPEASHMAFDVVVPLQGYFRDSDAETRLIPDEWGGAYFHTYARLRDGADIDDVNRGVDAFIDRNLPEAIAQLLSTAPHEFYKFRFVPIRNVHFDGGTVAAMKSGGSRATVFALTAVGILILVIASVNFANLTSARSLLRGREVALRKVVGASRRDVIYQFLVEAIVITLLASVIAIILTVLVLPQVGALLGSSETLRLTGSWTTLPLLAIVVLATALASGLYPALIVSRVRPGAILDREANRKTTGSLRSILVTLQFSVSIALIVITIGMLSQTHYANQVDLGFDRSNAMVLRIPDGPRRDEIAASMKTAVGQRPEVLGAALSSAVPSDSSEHNLSVSRPESPKPVQLGYHIVDSDFFRVYGVKPLSGRLSAMTQVVQRASQAGDDIPGSGAAVINAAALRPLNLGSAEQAIGQVLQSGDNSYTIVGVVPDLHFRSLHQRVRDEIYLLNDKAGGALTIRYKPGAAKRIASLIESDWVERSPERAIERVFLDDALDALYVQDTRQAYLLSLFALIAIALSCLGLVAMTSYSIQRRTKEIAIRKVLGARVSDIVRLLLWQSTRPVFAANLIAWPVAWLILRRWLNGFAYRIEMPYWAFAAATVIALSIAVAAIGWHTLRVSRVRPILALRHE